MVEWQIKLTKNGFGMEVQAACSKCHAVCVYDAAGNEQQELRWRCLCGQKVCVGFSSEKDSSVGERL